MDALKKIALILTCVLMVPLAEAQAPFHRGVNLTGWFQASSTRKIQFRKFTKKDFSDIKSLGCDVIRLPINLHNMTNGAPDYTVDPLFFTFLDSTVNWAEELQIYLLIDNHSFDPSVNTSPSIGQILTKVWPQIAGRYKDRSNYLYYEILNEPHGISNQLWGDIQQQAIDAVRAVDTKHTIVVGPSGYNSYNDLAQMPVYSDTNLLYTFHFYDPFMFTHQGAAWNTPSMASLSGVPFPYDPATMPPCPPDLVGTWVEQALNNYPAQGNVEYVHSLIDIAVNFRNARNINIFCGEFGAYIPNCDTADRVYWYQEVKDYLEAKNIPWTTWDYKGTFGLFEKGSHEIFESDLNIPLLQALDFNIPEQHSYLMLPDSAGFRIYDDYLEQGIEDATYSGTTADYYSDLYPNNDSYCLYWTGGSQYVSIVMDFTPDRDLSQLVEKDFAVDMLVRGSAPGTRFDVRFLDTKTDDPEDHPWRMRTTLEDDSPSWDKRWHHLYIPLKSFTEQGSWDNGLWFNPEGKFDWAAVDRFEIVAEHSAMDGKEVWFDNIVITDQDTASVLEKGTLSIENSALTDGSQCIGLAPNPMKSVTTITYFLPVEIRASVSIFDLKGQKVISLVDQIQPKGIHSVAWEGRDDAGNEVPCGIYICRLLTEQFSNYAKVLVFRS